MTQPERRVETGLACAVMSQRAARLPINRATTPGDGTDARAFRGNVAAGDMLVEPYLFDVMTDGASHEWHTHASAANTISAL